MRRMPNTAGVVTTAAGLNPSRPRLQRGCHGKAFATPVPNQHKPTTMLLPLIDPDTAFEKIKHLQQLKLKKSTNLRMATLEACWHLGAFLVMNEYTKTTARMEYIAGKLTEQFGRGFSRSNLVYMCKFFSCYKAHEIQQSTLTWSHYFEILKSKSKLELLCYTLYASKEEWTVRELKDKMRNMFFYRIGMRKICSINLKTRTLEEEAFISNVEFMASENKMVKHKLFCETRRAQKLATQQTPPSIKQKKTLHKLFRETRFQNPSAKPKKSRRKTPKTIDSNAPPPVSRELMMINYHSKTG
jgi:hypothetical protein